MPEYLIALALSTILGGFAWLNKRVSDVDDKFDAFTVKVVEEYATKESLASAMNRLELYFLRIEDKLDSQIIDLPTRVAHLLKEKHD